MTKIRRSAAALALTVAAGAVVAAGSLSPANAATQKYVALGDSYSSGDGAGSYGSSGACLRSANAYPELYAKAHPGTALSFVACAGAKVEDVLGKQVQALTADTGLVTISIGGNDVGFASVVTTCTFGSDAACTDRIAKSTATATTALPGKLDTTYAEIKTRSPRAQVVVLGYPRLFASGPAFCAISQTKRTALNKAADSLAEIIADRARSAGFTYEDVRDEFAGHGVCTSNPWIHGIRPLAVAESYHPTLAGQKNGYHAALTNAIG
ncbi:SGNH/GDSL hydrolase family protein [Actinokineospora spheciospongiae]|nr:SGNH/GDSL hydrolase family protein [Actinokineospora spheciospongiae]PWW63229.1 GDSL-like lipase/acylhydrolase family protein [Actinokineospora spheciospongiae]